MSFTDWTIDERKQIIDILKDCPASVRLSVRDEIKEMSAADALETVKALLSSSEDINGDNIGDKSKKPVKAPESPLETETKAGSGQKKSSSYKEKSPTKPVKPSEAVKGSIKPLETVKSPDKPLERVQGDIMTDNFDIEAIKQDIQALINNFTAVHGIEDLTKAPQRQFMALSSYIGQNYFKKSKILRDNTPRDNGSAAIFRNRDYDIPKLAACISLYFDICGLYNKAFLYDGVASFIGCSENTLRENSEKLTSFGIDLNQKRESSLSAGAVDPKTTNITGLLAALNHWHQWSGTGSNRTEVRETTVMYPVLVDINKNTSEGLPDNSNK